MNKLICLNDTSLTDIVKTNRHLVMRAKEYLRYAREKSEDKIKTQLKTCDPCKQVNLDNFHDEKNPCLIMGLKQRSTTY